MQHVLASLLWGGALAGLAGTAAAQTPPGAAEPALKAGRAAMESGDATAAYRHLLYALERSAEPEPVLRALLENARADPDARALWSLDYCSWIAGAEGRFKLDAGLAALLLEDDPHPLALCQARAAAVREMARFHDQQRKARRAGAPLLAEWAEDLGRRLGAPAPALWEKYGGAFTAEIAADAGLFRAVLDELESLVRAAQSRGDWSTVIRAARCLQGLAAQASFPHKFGPKPPNLDQARQFAGQALERAREALVERAAGFYSLEELEAMSWGEQRAATARHASFGLPAATRSPRGWYRVESSCGYETLYGAATTVELHHQRLANWYGTDPFVNRPGIVRVVPEAHGLEAEGAPFWWAGGFQGGDVTTVKFTIGTIPGLGRLLTHELTHRFDGAVYGGLPAWLGEGRAVWTAAAYGSMRDAGFVAAHCDFGAMSATLGLGYGAAAKMRELLAGEIEEYRDNYTAGYALYVYLNTWKSGDGDPPLYAERLHLYMEEERRRKGDAVAAFEHYFADGAQGRPRGLEEFAAAFRQFLEGFYWKEPAPFTARYATAVPGGDEARLVQDEPTWSWLRRRAEPWFGQEQARVAGELFAEEGREQAAVQALRWSLAVDEPSPYTVDLLASLLDKLGEDGAAWAVRGWERFRGPGGEPGPAAPAPFLEDLSELQLYLESWAAAARDYARRGAVQAAAAMVAEHDALAAALGLPPLDWAAFLPQPLPAWGTGILHPFSTAPRQIGFSGFGEDGLTGHEDRRVPGLWFVDHVQDLHVGRTKPRGGTDTMDRASHWRDAFVLANLWLEPGRYRLRTQIELTTAFASGGVVIGYTRRDRNLRFGFAAGDWDYAAGERDQAALLDGLSWSLDGLYARRDALRGGHSFGREKNFFLLEIEVDGPTAEVYLDGKLTAVQSTVDGRPIYGRIGVYTGHGAIRAAAPVVQRLDRLRHAPGGRAAGGGLHPQRPGAGAWRDLLERPVTGLPLSAAGTLLLWFPEPEPEVLEQEDAGAWIEAVGAAAALVAGFVATDGLSQGVTVVLPAAFPGDGAAKLRAEFHERVPGGWAVASHQHSWSLEEFVAQTRKWPAPTLAFVDPAGILKYTRRLGGLENRLPEELRTQLLIHLDHRRPCQAGAAE